MNGRRVWLAALVAGLCAAGAGIVATSPSTASSRSASNSFAAAPASAAPGSVALASPAAAPTGADAVLARTLDGSRLPAARAAAVVAFGRELFFESRLSGDGSRSCASCHAPDKGFADGEPLSRGYNHAGHFRNTPSLLGLASKRRLMWDGRYPADDLADVVVDMLVSPVTMNSNTHIVAERVRQIPRLLHAWQRAWGERAAPTIDGIVAALAAYSASHGNEESDVDRARHGDADALSGAALEGLRLFDGKAGCARCHSGAALTDGRLHRLGVPENPEILRDPERTIALLRQLAVHGARDPMSERSDNGAQAWTHRASDRGRFATPSLRGVAHTAPYMHNGTLATLAQVVDFYDRGGGRASELQPLGLDARERAALVAFLEALSPPLQPESAPPVGEYATTAGAGR
ncbi:MAG: cytochrome c peroxidase [Burkholderiaceae bacterium]|nr:cytochrome c peroxidase [Burkholderiaceae bacterium]